MQNEANSRRVRALMYIPATATTPARQRGDVFDATPQEWRDWHDVKVVLAEEGSEAGVAPAKKAPR